MNIMNKLRNYFIWPHKVYYELLSLCQQLPDDSLVVLQSLVTGQELERRFFTFKTSAQIPYIQIL